MKIKGNKPKDVAENMIKAGKKKANLSVGKMLILGFLAGAFVAMGGLLAIKIGAVLPDEIWGSMVKFIFAAVFPVGLMMIIVTGSELATGNMATQPLAWLTGDIDGKGVWKNWFFVLLGNILGSLFVAYFFGLISGLLTGSETANYVVNIANSKVSLEWGEAFWRGVGCNWLVGIAIWMAMSVDKITEKLILIWWPIMAFVAIGFEHSVANTFFVPAAIFVEGATNYSGIALQANWVNFVSNNLIPVLLGNIFGAAVFVSLVTWFIHYKSTESEKIEIEKQQARKSKAI